MVIGQHKNRYIHSLHVRNKSLDRITCTFYEHCIQLYQRNCFEQQVLRNINQYLYFLKLTVN